MNCPMFAYVLGRFILRLYTNYLYIIYRDVNISKLIPTHKYHLVIVPRILEIYLISFCMLCKVIEFVVWIQSIVFSTLHAYAS